ncbi:hypothetical protein RirG_080810 [Rhizophagus irregularis DAOM 197198w]|uniref:Uncharacterized protein n=1 Tax=Rhizophagus irregularis (strain DAOM 197198w) TaxID=1432141 RepID=A0A015KU99_RHIIW|nr:hypothetical protein RirG_080810 [Rhizophagus irregularis DAOM 197198w]
MNDKNNVVMSSYNTETKTGLPVKYLKYTKESLWEKFSYQFLNGVKRTSFMTFLQGKQYIYQENLGGLHEIFVEIKNFIEKNIQNNNLQEKLFQFTLFIYYKVYLFVFDLFLK